jgi:branched-chain amino acid transport system permease protein
VLYSPIGVQWRAIRENRIKAESLGIAVRRLQLLGYVMGGGIISLGGALLALLLQYIEPSIAGLNTLVQTVLMVALGGAGTIAGPVLGAFVITIVPELLRVTNELRLVIYGTTLMIIVLALPAGVVGTVHRLRRARRLAALSRPAGTGAGRG